MGMWQVFSELPWTWIIGLGLWVIWFACLANGIGVVSTLHPETGDKEVCEPKIVEYQNGTRTESQTCEIYEDVALNEDAHKRSGIVLGLALTLVALVCGTLAWGLTRG